MKNVIVLLSACGILLSLAFVSAADKKADKKAATKAVEKKVAAKIELKDIKCPVTGKAVKEASNVSYKGAKVFFCCDNCPKAFEKEIAKNAKFQTSANLQLVATKQAKQVKCPITGKDIDSTKTQKVDGVTVAFCCPNCQGKVAKADEKDKAALVFSDAAFAKGFKVGTGTKKDQRKSRVE